MGRLKKYLFAFLLLLLAAATALAQRPEKSLIELDNDHIYAGFRNHFRMVAQQLDPVGLDQLSAHRITYDPENYAIHLHEEYVVEQWGKGFMVRPDFTGVLCVTIQFQDGTKEQHTFEVRPLPALAKIGLWGYHTKENIPAIAFKAQRGLYALIENLDISAKCAVLEYEVLRVSANKEPLEEATNKGGNWEPETASLIKKAQPGDRYMFTRIYYRCPGSEVIQRATPISLTLK